MDGDQRGLGRNRLQPVPNRVLSFRAAFRQSIRQSGAKFSTDVFEGAFHARAHHNHDLVDIRRGVERAPCVRYDRPARDIEEQFVDVRPHAGASAGGNDNGGDHGKSLKGSEGAFKFGQDFPIDRRTSCVNVR